MDVIATYKKALRLFKKSFLPLFMVLSIFPLLELVLEPALQNYLILNSITIFEIVSFFLSLMMGAVAFISIDTLYHQRSFKIPDIFVKALDVLWPFFIFQLIWLIFGAIFALSMMFPLILFLGAFSAMLYLFVRVSVAIVLIIVEKEMVAKAFDRSFAMTKGRFWSISGLYLLLGLSGIALFLPFVYFIISNLETSSMESFNQLLAEHLEYQLIVYVFIGTVFSQLMYTTVYVLYRELVSKENLHAAAADALIDHEEGEA